MRTTDAQVRKLMEEMSTGGRVGRAAMRSGMDRKTARTEVQPFAVGAERATVVANAA